MIYLPIQCHRNVLGGFISLVGFNKTSVDIRKFKNTPIKSRMCTCNYSGTRFIPPNQGLIPGPSPAPVTAGEWGDKLRRS